MKKPKIVGGSVPGIWHLLPNSNPWLKNPGWLNNQDAYAWKINTDSFVAVVSDGCSSRPHTEVGSKLIANILTELLSEQSQNDLETLSDSFLQQIGIELLTHIERLARNMPGDYAETIYDNFIATFVATLVTPTDTHIIAAGDGYYAINNELQRIGPFPDDNPPYISYHLTGDLSPNAPLIPFVKKIPTADIKTILLATDGLEYLLPLSTTLIPDSSKGVGSWEQFIDLKIFDSSDSLTEKLVAIQNAFLRKSVDSKEPQGLLDDTAILSIHL